MSTGAAIRCAVLGLVLSQAAMVSCSDSHPQQTRSEMVGDALESELISVVDGTNDPLIGFLTGGSGGFRTNTNVSATGDPELTARWCNGKADATFDFATLMDDMSQWDLAFREDGVIRFERAITVTFGGGGDNESQDAEIVKLTLIGFAEDAYCTTWTINAERWGQP